MPYLALLSLIGLLVFLKGFFLTRYELRKTSSTDVPMKKKYDRVFVFIIDALRLDFITESSETSPFANVHSLLKHNASQTAFFGFRADPPTVTSQRLKGLTTGTLPTFVDIGSNFNGASIVEDNIVDQLRALGKRLLFVGDDTWEALFPLQFNVSIPFDSFNTKDIDSVDDGIEALLSPLLESEKESWHFFVAHFLGVDHIGHTFSSNHILMKERLQRMDRLVMEVINRLPVNSLFLLFGDHGMTDGGDHGGASVDETDSGLFVYSSKPMFHVCENRDMGAGTETSNESKKMSVKQTDISRLEWISAHAVGKDNSSGNESGRGAGGFKCRSIYDIAQQPRIINQVDLVPTLSLLLGLPIPHSNVGAIIPELFQMEQVDTTGACAVPSSSYFARGERGSGGSFSLLRRALLCNSLQVARYLLRYFLVTDELAMVDHVAHCIHDPRFVDCSWDGGDNLLCENSSSSSNSSVGTKDFDDIMTQREKEKVDKALQCIRTTTRHSKLKPLLSLLENALETHSTCLAVDQPFCTITSSTFNRTVSDTAAAQYMLFLEEVISFARREWTKFDVPMMAIGILVIAGTIVYVFIGLLPTLLVLGFPSKLGSISPILLCSICLACFHAVSVFSNSYIIEEYWVVFSIAQICCLLVVFKAVCIESTLYLDTRNARAVGDTDAPPATTTDSSSSSNQSPHFSSRSVASAACGTSVGYSLISLVMLRIAWALKQYPGKGKDVAGEIGSVNRHISSFFETVPIWIVACFLICSLCKTPPTLSLHLLGSVQLTSFILVLLLIGLSATAIFVGNRYHTDGIDIGTIFLPRTALIFLIGTMLLCFWDIYRFRDERMEISRLLIICCSVVCLLVLTSPSVTHMALIMSFVVTAGICYGKACAALSLASYDEFHLVMCDAKEFTSSLTRITRRTFPLQQSYSDSTAYFLSLFLSLREYNLNRKEVGFGGGGIICENKTHIGGCVTAKTIALSVDVILLVVLYFFALSRSAFFMSGHRMDFSALQLNSGFVGVSSFNFYYAGSMLMINTFGHEVVYALSLALFSLCFPTAATVTTTTRSMIHDLSSSSSLRLLLFKMHSIHRGVVLLCCCGCALWHRRHLMVWAVFAPKLAFEATGWMVATALTLLFTA